MRYFKCHIST